MRGCRTSLMTGIWLMNATIGVTMSAPTTGTCCNHASGGVWAMATTGGSTVASGSAGRSRLGAEVKDSRRAAAANAHITGDSIGAVGASPANGLRRTSAALDNAVVTTATGSCGGVAVDTSGCCTSIVTLRAGAVTTGASAVGGDGASATTGVSSTI